MKKHLILIPAMIITAFIGSRMPVVRAQTAVATIKGPEYTLVRSVVSSLQPGEKNCTFFLWTPILGAPRIAFNYLKRDGKTTDSQVVYPSDLVIQLDDSRSVPIAQQTGKDNDGHDVYMVYMNKITYDADARCLEKVAVQNK